MCGKFDLSIDFKFYRFIYRLKWKIKDNLFATKNISNQRDSYLGLKNEKQQMTSFQLSKQLQSATV